MGVFPLRGTSSQTSSQDGMVMKLQQHFISMAVVLLSTTLASSAAAQFTVNKVETRGTGCPEGTATSRLSPRGGDQDLTIRFRNFEAYGEAPENNRAKGDVATCNVAAIIQPDRGVQIGFVDVDIRGQVDVRGRRDTDMGINNVARIFREYFLNTPNSSSVSRTTSIVNSTGNYAITDSFAFISYAACNEQVIARAVFNLQVNGRGNYASIRRVDVESDGFRLGIRTRRCSDGDGPVIIPIASDETVQNACDLNGNRRVCYDRNGNVISNRPD